MNITLLNGKPHNPKPKKKFHGMTVTLHPNNKGTKSNWQLIRSQSLQGYQPRDQSQTNSIFGECCQQESTQRVDTETDMPKKYINPIKPLTLTLNLPSDREIIALPHDFSLLKTQESSSKQCSGSLWNPDSPVNRLY